jgi:hypothetical protein
MMRVAQREPVNGIGGGTHFAPHLVSNSHQNNRRERMGPSRVWRIRISQADESVIGVQSIELGCGAREAMLA